MLDSIQVKNVALIDAAEVEFEKGLNILTGETGAGKSILLSSVQLALGAKADKSLIRQGAEYASVTLSFSPSKAQREQLHNLDIDCEDDILILQRRIYPTKSVCKINGETVVQKTMQSVAELLIDIHGQREHQAVLKASVQEEMLDAYCMDAILADLEKTKLLYQEYKDLEKQLLDLEGQDTNRERELDFARFELDEIQKAELKLHEDEELQEQYERLSNAKKIKDSVGNANDVLCSSNQSILNSLSLVLRDLSQVKDYDAELAQVYSQLSDVENSIQDCGHFLDRYLDRFGLESGDLAAVTERLNLINHLKDKYGNSLEDILQYAEDLSDKIEQIENREQYLIDKQKELEKLKAEYESYSQKLHKMRAKMAKDLSDKMMQALADLNFEQCRFEVECEYRKDQMKKNGCSYITFMISLNRGEPLKPLAAVASGGELSRIMLAFKSVFADKDQTETLVFDEIDAGISGKTAWKVSEKLAVLRNNHQVICITHLPQIAAMADVHFCIEKSSSDERTSTTVEKLDENESIAEIGRLLGTDQLTDAVLQNALEMKNMAKQTKQY
ncbi:MAG: DNA repair protein RecN [Lachnospiraceae bacterium]